MYFRYHLKFRYWYQEYDSSYHKGLIRWTYSGEAGPVEYDVPQCAPGTPTEDCVHMIYGNWKVSDMISMGDCKKV